MKINTSLIIIFYIFFSCSENKKEAKDILRESIEAAGGNKINNTKMIFDVGDLHYILKRKGYYSKFFVERTTDSINYLATYEGGHQEYFIGKEKQDINPVSRIYINRNLEGFTYLLSIPFSIDHNSITIQRNDDVVIRGKKYYTIHAKEKMLDNEEGMPNEFYLYINQNTSLVDYYAENYKNSGNKNYFTRRFNHRKINGIVFTDFYVFEAGKSSIPLNEMYKFYEIGHVKDIKEIKLTNIQVEEIDFL